MPKQNRKHVSSDDEPSSSNDGSDSDGSNFEMSTSDLKKIRKLFGGKPKSTGHKSTNKGKPKQKQNSDSAKSSSNNFSGKSLIKMLQKELERGNVTYARTEKGNVQPNISFDFLAAFLGRTLSKRLMVLISGPLWHTVRYLQMQNKDEIQKYIESERSKFEDNANEDGDDDVNEDVEDQKPVAKKNKPSKSKTSRSDQNGESKETEVDDDHKDNLASAANNAVNAHTLATVVTMTEQLVSYFSPNASVRSGKLQAFLKANMELPDDESWPGVGNLAGWRKLALRYCLDKGIKIQSLIDDLEKKKK
jgi:hypothetical protein